MKIETFNFYNDDYVEYFKFVVDGKTIFTVGGGEPEDNSIGRDLSFVYDIDGLMKEAFEVGLTGGTFEVIHTACKTSEEFWSK